MRKNKKCEKVQKWETTVDPPRGDEGVGSKEPTLKPFLLTWLQCFRGKVLWSLLSRIQRFTK